MLADLETRVSIIHGSRFGGTFEQEDRRGRKKQKVSPEQRITCAGKMSRSQISKTGAE